MCAPKVFSLYVHFPYNLFFLINNRHVPFFGELGEICNVKRQMGLLKKLSVSKSRLNRQRSEELDETRLLQVEEVTRGKKVGWSGRGPFSSLDSRSVLGKVLCADRTFLVEGFEIPFLGLSQELSLSLVAWGLA